MRVLHFYKTYYPDSVGGVEQVIFQLCRGSRKYGVESSVLSLTRNSIDRTIQLDGHKVDRAKMNFEIASTAISVSSIIRFFQLAKQADIIHYHYPWPFMDLVHFLTKHKKPSIVTYHSDIIRQKMMLKLYRPLKHFFLRNVNQIVGTSPNYLKTSHVLDRYRDKVTIIPIGLDKSSYPIPSLSLIDQWREKLGDQFFLFVGMLRYYKGLHILLEAMKGTEYPLVIAGSGPMEIKLKERARHLGLRNVHFLGTISDIDKVALLQLSFTVILPSHLRSEAFGISLLEGAMYGKPMISCEIGTGTSYININNETGLVVNPDDSMALRTAMQVLWKNRDMAAEMGKKAEQHYWKYFTAEQMIKSYAHVYENLLASEKSI